MSFVRFDSDRSRSASACDEFLKVWGDFDEKIGGKPSGHPQHAGEHPRHETAKVTESDRAIHPPWRIRFDQLLGRQIGSQGIEVVAHHICHDILAGGEASQAGGVFETEEVFETLESLLDTPAAVIKIGEGGRGIALGIEQGGHEYADLARRSHLADQAHGRCLTGALVINLLQPLAGWFCCHFGSYRSIPSTFLKRATP